MRCIYLPVEANLCTERKDIYVLVHMIRFINVDRQALYLYPDENIVMHLEIENVLYLSLDGNVVIH